MNTIVPMRQTSRRALGHRSYDAIRLLALWIVALISVAFPLSLVALTAVKPTGEARSVSMELPTRIDFLGNLETVLIEGKVLQGFLNSLLITGPAVFLLLLLGAAAAWVFARTNSHLLRVLYYIAISGVMLPPTIVTTLRVQEALQLDGTQIGLILFYAGTQLSIAIFLITGFVKTVPLELEEAARIDGASTLRIFFQIILPNLQPVLLTTGIILTLFIWNDFLAPFFMLPSSDEQTMPLGLYNFASANAYELNWNLIFTHVIVVSLPLLILFVVAQRGIVSGLLGGAVK